MANGSQFSGLERLLPVDSQIEGGKIVSRDVSCIIARMASVLPVPVCPKNKTRLPIYKLAVGPLSSLDEYPDAVYSKNHFPRWFTHGGTIVPLRESRRALPLYYLADWPNPAGTLLPLCSFRAQCAISHAPIQLKRKWQLAMVMATFSCLEN
jgi:hypothetical protein